MCVVERKTYIHSNGRREVVEKHRRCHNAPRNGLCAFVERKEDSARVVEMRPSSSRASSAQGEVVTTSRDGRSHRYDTVSRQPSSRRTSGRTSRTSDRSPADSMSPPAPISPIYKEVKPEAPMPPPVARRYPSARRSDTISPTFPPDPDVRVGPGGTAVYDRPPSLEMPRADINERQNLSRPSSFSSTSADVDDTPFSGSKRRVSFSERRGTDLGIDVEAAAGRRSSPGLGNLPNPFADSLPRGSRTRVDSAADELRRQQQEEEDDRQARLETAKIAEAERRQRARIRKADAAAAEARERAAEIERERADSSQERRDRERRRTAAALEDATRARQDAEIERKFQAEVAQVAREKAEADARAAQQYQPIRPSATSSPSRISYHNTSPISARGTTTTISARGPYSVAVHNYPSTRKDSISQRGEVVIAREQARAAAERMNDAMASVAIDEDDDDDEDLNAEMRRNASRRTGREGKDRERQQKKERERRLKSSGFI